MARFNGNPVVPSSGSTTKIGTYANLASAFPSPVEGDTYLLTNSAYDKAVYDGSSWTYWRGGFKCTLPVAAGYTDWVNQGSAAEDSAEGAFEINCPTSNAPNMRGKRKALAAGDFEKIVALAPPLLRGLYTASFFGLYEFAGDNFIGWRFGHDASTLECGIVSLGTASAVPTNVYTVGNGYSTPVLLLKITRVGTTVSFFLSVDKGENWSLFHSATETSYGAVSSFDHFFFGVYTYQTGTVVIRGQLIHEA